MTTGPIEQAVNKIKAEMLLMDNIAGGLLRNLPSEKEIKTIVAEFDCALVNFRKLNKRLKEIK